MYGWGVRNTKYSIRTFVCRAFDVFGSSQGQESSLSMIKDL
nr:MAG TPA: hypothetical protein [Caudoviricetes sp.]